MNIDIVILKKRKISSCKYNALHARAFFSPWKAFALNAFEPWKPLNFWNSPEPLVVFLLLETALGPTKWDCNPGKYEICVLPSIYLIEEKIHFLFSLGLFKWEDTTLGRTVVIFSGIRRVCLQNEAKKRQTMMRDRWK